MHLGFGLPTAGAWATPDSVVTIARRAEALGYRSVWAFQRLLYPVAPQNLYYGAPGAAWPDAFRSVLDPLVALSFVAAATERVRLGASVLLMPFYSPVLLARMLASIDIVSRGRLDVGVGTGWSLDELQAVGVPPDERGPRADEFLECLKAAWTGDEVEFTGRFYTIPRSRIDPKPVQRPHPPLLIGGYSDRVFRRVARHGDGYAGGNIPLADMAAVVGGVQRAAVAAGRDPGELRIVCRGSFNVTAEPEGDGRRALWGTLDQIRDDVRRYEAAGVTELFFEPNFQPGGPVLERVLDAMEALAPGRW
ncbi:MAG: LLM class F420-dependent oxidoreductase [Candidatus Rokubacteria bacterium]|nr:LLM class F420-dependent oxidoreductase [Candidatus Rokubacteria bacterium]